MPGLTLGSPIGADFRELQLESQIKQNKLLDLQIKLKQIEVERAEVSLVLLKQDVLR